jgi:peptidoglycan/LPS O-acetylase OafA/YrhL
VEILAQARFPAAVAHGRSRYMDKSRNEGLQAARAIAALTVAYFHSYVVVRGAFPESAWLPIPWLAKWGFLGVDLFFAISGYVICLVVDKPSFTVGGFAIKRLLRLYPMYWVAMALVLVLVAWGKYPPQPPSHFLYSMTLLPQHGPPAYDVSWTLEREVVFYALAGAIVPLLGITGLACTLAALAAAGWWFGNPWSLHLVSITQADFLAGVIVYLARHRLAAVPAPLWLTIGIGALIWTCPFTIPFSIPTSMLLILAGLARLQLPWQRAPFSWLVGAGNASYSIYLLHYIVFMTLSVIGGQKLPFALPAWACEPWRAGGLLTVCLVSHATFLAIERPMILLGERLAKPRQNRS